MIRSGRNVPTPAMPMPDFAVPYAAPTPDTTCQSPSLLKICCQDCSHPKIIYNSDVRLVHGPQGGFINASLQRMQCRPAKMLAWDMYGLVLRLTIPKKGANLGVNSESAILYAIAVDKRASRLREGALFALACVSSRDSYRS